MKNLSIKNVDIYPFNLLSMKKPVYVAIGTTLHEISSLKAKITPKEDGYSIRYVYEHNHNGAELDETEFHLYWSLEDLKNGNPIKRESFTMRDLFNRASNFNKFNYVKSADKMTFSIVANELKSDHCERVERDVTEISVNYNINEYRNCDWVGDLSQDNCILNAEDARHYLPYSVIDGNGKTIETHRANVDVFRLTDEQKKMADEFIALYEKMKKNGIAFVLDSEDDFVVLANNNAKDWGCAYDEPDGAVDCLPICVVEDVCPTISLHTDYCSCDDRIYIMER